MEATECGAAALAIVLGYYGRFVPLEELRIDCGVSRNGSQAINLLKAARRHGMIAKGAQVEDPALLSEIDFPFIVFWELDHFVVLEGIRNDRFFLNDPATGRRRVDLERFDRAFTGIVLLLEPGPGFERQGSAPGLIGPLLSRLDGAAAEIGFVTAATLALVVPGIVVAGASKVFVDSVLVRDLTDWAYPLIVGLLIAGALRGALTWVQEKALMRLQIKLSLIHSTTFLWHILHLPVSFHGQRYVGDIAERARANERIANLISGELTAALVGLISATLYAAAMLFLAWQIAAAAIAVASLMAAMFLSSARVIGDRSRLLLQRQGQLAGLEANALLSTESLKGSGWEDVFFKRWAGLHAETINTQQQLETVDTALSSATHLLYAMSTVVLIGYGSVLIIRGEISAGTLVALQSLLIGLLAPLATLVGLGQQAQEIRGDLMRLQDGLSQSPDPYYGAPRRSLRKSDSGTRIDKVRVAGLTFGYSPVDGPVLTNVGFELERGKRIAMVGETGSGKSTLGRLLCRCYTPWSGRILIDDVPLEDVVPDRLARLVALVEQDTCLFEGTVLDNLTLWTPGVAVERLQRAVSDACLDDVLSGRGGLLGRVQEGGVNFSGGERQRLEIARALVAEPAVVVLDEATASLDRMLERRIFENLKRRGCALLIITHRLSALADCDEILVFAGGRVIERGTHGDLLALGGAYRELLAAEGTLDGQP
jgi:NHLM bacteriocin system ABC transporter peptidase/ATP-binding protein